MSNTVYLKVTTNTGFSGCDHTDTVEFDREDWDSMTLEERDDLVSEVGLEPICISAKLVDGNGEPTGEDWYL